MRPKRSRLRMQVGRMYYSMKRYAEWMFSGISYTKERWQGGDNDGPCSHVVFRHASPTMRELRDVDMWLQVNKVHNLRLAVPKLHRIVLRPGDTMSYWRLIGSPSRWRGYRQGMVLSEGTFRPGYGGGLCQLSNLIYWMTLHTPLTVTERFRHQYDVFPDANRTLPFGSGATCSYNYVDLQIRNDTDRTFCLLMWVTDTELRGEWRSDSPQEASYEVYEKNHRFAQNTWGMYTRHNEIWRRVLDRSGEEIGNEFITANDALMMYNPLLPSGT